MDIRDLAAFAIGLALGYYVCAHFRKTSQMV